MGKLTFKGGIHPYEGKELSKNSPIEKYLPKRRDGLSAVSAYWSSVCSLCEQKVTGSWQDRRLQKPTDLYPYLCTLLFQEP